MMRKPNHSRAWLRTAVYPLLCALSLALLPYQPEHDPTVLEAALIAQAFTAPMTPLQDARPLLAAEQHRR